MGPDGGENRSSQRWADQKNSRLPTSMEVTRENFFDVLPFIEESINSCDFMALDLEMTGLSSGKMERQKRWDSAQQRYTKVRDGASVICPTQFGLCTFKYSAESKQYAQETIKIVVPTSFSPLYICP